jgi:hypothetical protein
MKILETSDDRAGKWELSFECKIFIGLVRSSCFIPVFFENPGALPATGTEEYEQVPGPCDIEGRILNPGCPPVKDRRHLRMDLPVFQEKLVGFRSLKEPLYFQAIAVIWWGRLKGQAAGCPVFAHFLTLL